MKKNGFLTFCFALIPGAGQMYLGYMKRGTSLMTGFALVIGIAVLLEFPYLTIALPVMWFYSFFDTFRLRESLLGGNSPEDSLMFGLEGHSFGWGDKLFEKRHTLLGTGCIVAGLMILYNIFVEPVLRELAENGYDWLYTFIYRAPTVLVAVAIIVLGIVLLRGKKSPVHTAQQEDYQEFKGENHE